jgi:hypothetical protein
MHRRLAVSFVVTVSAVSCRSPSTRRSPPFVDKNGAACHYHPANSAAGNPPAVYEVDCPPELGGPPIGSRPKGKESWLRMRPWLQPVAAESRCRLYGEGFCPAPPLDAPCTWAVELQSVRCTAKASGIHVEPFVWKDAVGTCRRVAAFQCDPGCKVPDGEVVPCG